MAYYPLRPQLQAGQSVAKRDTRLLLCGSSQRRRQQPQSRYVGGNDRIFRHYIVACRRSVEGLGHRRRLRKGHVLEQPRRIRKRPSDIPHSIVDGSGRCRSRPHNRPSRSRNAYRYRTAASGRSASLAPISRLTCFAGRPDISERPAVF